MACLGWLCFARLLPMGWGVVRGAGGVVHTVLGLYIRSTVYMFCLCMVWIIWDCGGLCVYGCCGFTCLCLNALAFSLLSTIVLIHGEYRDIYYACCMSYRLAWLTINFAIVHGLCIYFGIYLHVEILQLCSFPNFL